MVLPLVRGFLYIPLVLLLFPLAKVQVGIFGVQYPHYSGFTPLLLARVNTSVVAYLGWDVDLTSS